MLIDELGDIVDFMVDDEPQVLFRFMLSTISKINLECEWHSKYTFATSSRVNEGGAIVVRVTSIRVPEGALKTNDCSNERSLSHCHSFHVASTPISTSLIFPIEVYSPGKCRGCDKAKLAIGREQMETRDLSDIAVLIQFNISPDH